MFSLVLACEAAVLYGGVFFCLIPALNTICQSRVVIEACGGPVATACCGGIKIIKMKRTWGHWGLLHVWGYDYHLFHPAHYLSTFALIEALFLVHVLTHTHSHSYRCRDRELYTKRGCHVCGHFDMFSQLNTATALQRCITYVLLLKTVHRVD